MKLSRAIGASLTLLFFTPGLAQEPQPAAQPTPPGNEKQQQKSATQKNGDEVVRISVTLVQVDVSVTDGKGRSITDLKPEDFEVFQNKKPQHITNFSYVAALPNQAAAPPVARSVIKGSPVEPPPPPPRLRPEQVRRAVALVVDDLTLSFESMSSVRQALKKFVDEQMQPGDLAAIIRTGAGMGALQQFTNDKRRLYASIERVRWKPGYGAVNTFDAVSTDPSQATLKSLIDPRESVPDKGDLSGNTGAKGPAIDQPETFRQEVFTIGTLGALGFVVRGLKELPGRKSVVVFSDALRIYNREQGITRVQQALDNLTDLANRAAVSFYTIDARGLQVLGISAADDLAGDIEGMPNNSQAQSGQNTDYTRFIAKTETTLSDRSREFIESQEGLQYLANRTGGLFTKNNNDLSRGVSRALQDQEGYYLIGFVPDESTFKSKNGAREFQNISVKVKTGGLRVRTRTGFYGVTDEETHPLKASAGKQLLNALASPFGAKDIRVRMTSQFWEDKKGGAFVNAMVHIDANDMMFEETVNGWRRATFEIAAFTFGDNGQVIDRSDRGYMVSMSDQDYRRTLEKGIFYRINLPIKKPGAYQLRAAVMDQQSKKLGSANEFIEIPDLKKGRLTLSGLIVRGSHAASNAGDAKQTIGQEGRVEEADSQASPAVRRFRRGMIAEYGYVIYNAKADKTTGKGQLATQVRLYRDGRLVYDGGIRPFDPKEQTDLRQLIAGGSVRLGNDLASGEYALQVIVIDKLAKEKERMATNWIDFEIVRGGER
jgi:VWFA-related protein